MMAAFLLLVIGCHTALSHHNNKGSQIGIMVGLCSRLILEYFYPMTCDLTYLLGSLSYRRE